MNKRNPKINGKTIIGFDETHNGFHLNSRYNFKLPLIITGYKVKDYCGKGSQNTNVPFGRKCHAFGENRNEDEILRRSRGFFNNHLDFYYSVILEENNTESAIYQRAMAITAITLKFLNQKEHREQDVYVFIDKPNDNSYAEKLEERLNEMFNLGCIFPGRFSDHVIIKEKADKTNKACRLADSAGYHVLSLHSLANEEKRPYRSKLVSPYTLFNLIDERHRLLEGNNFE